MTARDDAWAIFEALHGEAGWVTNLTGIDIGAPNLEAQTIEALADPQFIGQDDKNRYEFSTNFIFRMKEV